MQEHLLCAGLQTLCMPPPRQTKKQLLRQLEAPCSTGQTEGRSACLGYWIRTGKVSRPLGKTSVLTKQGAWIYGPKAGIILGVNRFKFFTYQSLDSL